MALQQKLQSLLDEETADRHKIPGAVVVLANKNGDLLAHVASGVRSLESNEPMAKDQLHWIASCTKLITAIACMQLVEQGKVKLNEPVQSILPELSQAKINENGQLRSPTTKITLDHLLLHTSGLAYEFFNPTTKEHFVKNGIKSFDSSKASISAPLVSEPGTAWEYGTGIDWAAQVVERTSGMDLDSYFKKNIFTPLGIKEITTLPESGIPGGVKPRLASMNLRGPDGKIKQIPHHIQMDEKKIEVQYGGAGCFADAVEYVQILIALMNGGTHPKTKGQILKPESVEQLLRDRLPDHLVKDLDRPFEAVMPELSNRFISLEGVPKQWALGGCKTPQGVPNGRSSDSVWWAGIANHYWFMDRADGTCGMIQAQVLPFFDGNIVPWFFFKAEPLAHEYAKTGKA